MRRAVVTLLGLAACVVAGPNIVENESDIYLAGGPEPVEVVYRMERASAEVHLLFEFRFGLYGVSPDGEREAAIAGVRLEYAREGGEFVAAPVQPEANPDWTADPAGEPGLWFTRGDAQHKVERTLVFRFPEVDRYRIRIVGLFRDTASLRRIPHLVGIREVSDEIEDGIELIDGDDVDVVEAEDVVVVERPIVVFEEPPCPCPFCGGGLYLSARVGRAGYWNCGGCSGAGAG